MKKRIIFTLLLFLPLYLFSQAFKTGKISPFTAHFLSSYDGNATDSTTISKLQNRFLLKKIKNQDYVNAFILLNDNADLDVLRSNGVKINIILPTIITAQVPVQDLENIAMLPQVRNIQIGTPVHRKMNRARALTNVDQVQAGTNLSSPFLGKHVVIGIIDSGIEYGHINFFDSTGTTLRIKHVWDQNITGISPTGFSYGTEYTTQSAILAAKFDNQTETHGTHVTGIAAGADKSNNNIYYGVAPGADIAMVSYNLNDQTSDNVSISDGLKYLYDYATSVNEPCVVNMSLGLQIGPHDGTSAFDQVCDALQGKGRLLVGAAGNEGSDSLHISQTFTPTNSTLKTFFGYYKNTKLTGLSDIWGDANKTFSIRVVVYNRSTGVEVYTTPALDAASSVSKTYTLTSANGASGTIQVFTERNAVNNKPNAFVASDMSSINAGNSIGIILTAQNGTVHAWADDFYSYFTGNKLSGWTNGNSANSVGEIGGTGKQIISVGAYVSKTTFTNIQGTSYRSPETLNQIASFSSTGPTIDGRTKPDITAPGSVVISSYSSAIISDPNYSNYIVKKSTVKGKNYYYGQLEGTSMATPMVTGILATWLEAKNDLSPDEVRTVLQQTSITDSYTGTIPSTGNNTWGSGKIDALSGILACLKLAMLQKVQTSSDNYFIYPNPTSGTIFILFGKKDSNVQLSVYNLNGQRVYTQQLGDVAIAQEATITLPSLATGVYLVTLSGNLQYKSYHLLKR
jgi:minor extracellular serine protease Vpr